MAGSSGGVSSAPTSVVQPSSSAGGNDGSTMSASSTPTNPNSAGTTNTAAVYTDSMQGSWQGSFSWASTYSLTNSGSYTYQGSDSISWVPTNFDGLYFTCDGSGTTTCFDNSYNNISFWSNGGASEGNVQIRVRLRDGNKNEVGNIVMFTTQTNNWAQTTIPLTQFQATGPFSGFTLQENAGASSGNTMYLDEIYVNPGQYSGVGASKGGISATGSASSPLSNHFLKFIF